MGGGSSTPSSGHFTPGKETWYPLYRRLGRSEGLSGRVRKVSPTHRDSIPGPTSLQRILLHRCFISSVTCSVNFLYHVQLIIVGIRSATPRGREPDRTATYAVSRRDHVLFPQDALCPCQPVAACGVT